MSTTFLPLYEVGGSPKGGWGGVGGEVGSGVDILRVMNNLLRKCIKGQEYMYFECNVTLSWHGSIKLTAVKGVVHFKKQIDHASLTRIFSLLSVIVYGLSICLSK